MTTRVCSAISLSSLWPNTLLCLPGYEPLLWATLSNREQQCSGALMFVEGWGEVRFTLDKISLSALLPTLDCPPVPGCVGCRCSVVKVMVCCSCYCFVLRPGQTGGQASLTTSDRGLAVRLPRDLTATPSPSPPTSESPPQLTRCHHCTTSLPAHLPFCWSVGLELFREILWNVVSSHQSYRWCNHRLVLLGIREIFISILEPASSPRTPNQLIYYFLLIC